ncbi:putative membrane protein [hydrothermal vent metagenome]|uniref:Putative membrane protein n=1 Tax=hydrothermal vent metagenome TaxID=652676 RepID=A0A3B0XA80_9ZZZZ
MSIKTSLAVSSVKFWLQMLSQDQASIRSIRFAVGVSIAVAIAYGINWPLAFLMPVLTSIMLSLPLPMPSLHAGLRNISHTIKAFALGLVFSIFFLKYPLVYILMLGLVLFHLYYYLNRGGSFWLTLISMVAILLLPVLASSGEGLAAGFSFGFIYSGGLTVIMVWIAHLLVPDPQFSAFPLPAKFQNIYSPAAAQSALKSTLIIFPMASLFIAFNLMDYLLVMIFSAIFILKPELSAGKEAGKNSLISTLLGGLCAMIFYWLIVAVPEYIFYITLMFLTTLFFGRKIYSTKPSAKYYGSAYITLLILVNGSMAEGADFSQLLVNRILLIILATGYILITLKLLDSYWPNKHTLKS